ncbi:MAG: STAS domain-containing protein [Pseudonocardiaceae bacterium]
MLARSMTVLTQTAGVPMSDGYVARYSSHDEMHPRPGKTMLSAELTHPCWGTVVCTVIGEIDMFTTPALDEALRAVTHIGPGHLIVDLSGVTFLGSHGLRALVERTGRSTGNASSVSSRTRWPSRGRWTSSG